jgi:hypothetical protein
MQISDRFHVTNEIDLCHDFQSLGKMKKGIFGTYLVLQLEFHTMLLDLAIPNSSLPQTITRVPHHVT